MGKGRDGVEVRENSIRLSFRLDGVKHVRTLKVLGEPMLPTQSNINRAHRVAVEIRERIKHGTFSMVEHFPDDGAVSGLRNVGAQLASWLAGMRIEDSTRAAYASAAKFWTKEIGDVPLRQLKPGQIKIALASRAHLSGKTVNNYVAVLREALELAMLDNLIPNNPVAHIPRATRQKPPVDPFTKAEVEQILGYMAANYPSQVEDYTEFKFFTGLRSGESFGLRWPNVNLTDKTIVVSEGVVRGVEKQRTKTNSVRTVMLNSRAAGALAFPRLGAESGDLQGHVFLDPRYAARWSDERAFRRSYWEPCLRALGIRYRPPYNTRHTYATMMLMAGMTPAFCAGQMGHSVEIFLGTYSKWISGAGDASEMEKLEATLK